MADVAATRQLFVRMGFTQAAANALTDKQGIANLDELCLLTDAECTTLCKTLRRPGGTIIPAGGGDPVANPGHSVSLVAEKNLKLVVYYLNHKKRCHVDAIRCKTEQPPGTLHGCDDREHSRVAIPL